MSYIVNSVLIKFGTVCGYWSFFFWLNFVVFDQINLVQSGIIDHVSLRLFWVKFDLVWTDFTNFDVFLWGRGKGVSFLVLIVFDQPRAVANFSE